MKIRLSHVIAFMFVAGISITVGCKKEEALTTPPEQVHFTGSTGASYSVVTANSSYKIPVGVTTVSNVERVFTFSVSSSTGAVAGTHYNITRNNIIIPAGKALDSIEVKGVLAAYTGGRKDTLTFNLAQAGKEAGFNNVFKLALRGPCFEGDVDLNVLLGTYAKTTETFGTGAPYGPYTTTISKVQSLTATTGTITVTNIFDDGWSPLIFTLDWTNPAVRRITLVTQNAGGNAANAFGPTYAGQPYGVRPVPGGTTVGTFSICNQTLVLRMQVGIFGVGYSTDLYTVNMNR